MKKLILFSFACSCLLSFIAPLQAQDKSNASRQGKFEMKQNNKEVVALHYSIRPSSPENIVLQINPSSAVAFSARIVNQQGAQAIQLDSYEGSLRYVREINISALKRGNYFVEITEQASGNIAARLPFSK